MTPIGYDVQGDVPDSESSVASIHSRATQERRDRVRVRLDYSCGISFVDILSYDQIGSTGDKERLCGRLEVGPPFRILCRQRDPLGQG